MVNIEAGLIVAFLFYWSNVDTVGVGSSEAEHESCGNQTWPRSPFCVFSSGTSFQLLVTYSGKVPGPPEDSLWVPCASRAVLLTWRELIILRQLRSYVGVVEMNTLFK